jgi:GNAT superfamily N-acetyltransferase
MIVRLERIQTAGHRYFDDILKLYLDSFPKEERREFSALPGILHVSKMHFCAVLAGDELSGMVVYWKFEKYLYLEHLAVIPGKRGAGIGSQILSLLQNEGCPILLEVEIPFDEASKKRVEFYSRAGFNQLDISYLQPPYRQGERLLPMMLYSDKSDWDAEILLYCIQEFHSQVYYNP